MLIVLEDAHWIDATTLEMMMRLTDSIGRARALAVVTARPDFAPPWLARPHATLLTLGRLGRQECAQLVAGVAAAHGLSAETVATIVAKTDGVPLVRRGVDQERDGIGGRGRRGAGDAQGFADGASRPPRRGARGGADRRRHRPAIQSWRCSTRSARGMRTNSRPRWRSSSRRELSFPKSAVWSGASASSTRWCATPPMRACCWRGGANGTDASPTRSRKHFADIAAREPDLLAYHFGEAGLPVPACDYRMRAGDQAVSRSAYPEAIAHFSAGLKLAEAMPPQDGTAPATGFSAQARLGLGRHRRACTARRWRMPIAAPAKSARNWATVPGCFRPNGACGSMPISGARPRSRATGPSELVTLAQNSGDEELLLEAYHCQWSTAFFRGDVADALERLPARHRTLRHGAPPPSRPRLRRSRSRRLRALAVRQLAATGGRRAGGRAKLRAGGWPRRNTRPSQQSCPWPAQFRHRSSTWGRSRRHLHRGTSRRGTGGKIRPDAVARQQPGAGEPGRPRSVQVVADATPRDRCRDRQGDSGGSVAAILSRPCRRSAAHRRPAADGLAHLDRAIAGIDEPGVGFYLPEIYRLRGACLLALDRDNKDAAQAAFSTALDIARRQGAVILQRRAEAAIAELSGK